MGITIPIAPPGVMPIGDSSGCNAIDGVFQVLYNAGFMFDGCDRSRRAWHEDENLPLRQPRLIDLAGYMGGDVNDVRIATGLERQVLI